MGVLTSQIAQTGAVIPVRKEEGKVVGSELRYLFESFDSRLNPNSFSPSLARKPVIRDKNLKERVKPRNSVADYVANLYGK